MRTIAVDGKTYNVSYAWSLNLLKNNPTRQLHVYTVADDDEPPLKRIYDGAPHLIFLSGLHVRMCDGAPSMVVQRYVCVPAMGACQRDRSILLKHFSNSLGQFEDFDCTNGDLTNEQYGTMCNLDEAEVIEPMIEKLNTIIGCFHYMYGTGCFRNLGDDISLYISQKILTLRSIIPSGVVLDYEKEGLGSRRDGDRDGDQTYTTDLDECIPLTHMSGTMRRGNRVEGILFPLACKTKQDINTFLSNDPLKMN